MCDLKYLRMDEINLHKKVGLCENQGRHYLIGNYIQWGGYTIVYVLYVYRKHIIISYEHTKSVPKRKMPWSEKIDSRTIPPPAVVVDIFKI